MLIDLGVSLCYIIDETRKQAMIETFGVVPEQSKETFDGSEEVSRGFLPTGSQNKYHLKGLEVWLTGGF